MTPVTVTHRRRHNDLIECKDSRDDDYACQKLRFGGSRSSSLSEELIQGGDTGIFGDEDHEATDDLDVLEMLRNVDASMSPSRLAESQSVATSCSLAGGPTRWFA
jgi:hypothetical protein